MIHESDIEEIINYLEGEAGDYARLGGMNEAWGLRHAVQRLKRLLKDKAFDRAVQELAARI